MKIEVSNGEILDKYSILQIKLEKIIDKTKLQNVIKEIEYLNVSYTRINKDDVVHKKYKELKDINIILWDIEDKIREKEKDKDFGKGFVELARAVYITNDKRSKVKYLSLIHI